MINISNYTPSKGLSTPFTPDNTGEKKSVTETLIELSTGGAAKYIGAKIPQGVKNAVEKVPGSETFVGALSSFAEGLVNKGIKAILPDAPKTEPNKAKTPIAPANNNKRTSSNCMYSNQSVLLSINNLGHFLF